MFSLERLTLTRKFLLLGVLVLLIVSLPTALYVQRALADVSFAEREAAGLPPIIALHELIRLAQQHRGISAAALSGNEGLGAQRPAVRDAMTKTIDKVEAALKTSDAGATINGHWAERKRRWLALEQAVAGGQLKAVESTALHTRLISEVLRLMDEVADAFQMSLDPSAEGYFLIQATIVDAPMLAEKVGQMRAHGTTLLSTMPGPAEGRVALAGLQRDASTSLANFVDHLDKAGAANARIKDRFAAKADLMQTQVTKALDLASTGVISPSGPKLTAKDYFQEFSNALNVVYDLNAIAIAELDSVLQKRIAETHRGTLLVLGILLAALVACSVLSLMFVRSILRQLGAEPRVAAAVAASVAHGDLSHAIVLKRGDQISLLAQLKAMQESLARTVASVRASASSVASASTQIAQGNQDLSQRTEEQASSLQETAASMEQLSATVRQNADNARQANQLALGASSVASKGGEVVGQVVQTMRGINDASRKIADIIGVIDGIAFQTNILALNAAVEAARAGEQGRGFAVVASEVRSLAQRSAEAAKEIKALIGDSVTRVEQGSALADRAGETMSEIVSAIQRVTDIMGEISSASSEQSQGVAQVGEAITQMDQVTQQNAALVEQSAAAAESLKGQAQELVRIVAVFKTAEAATPLAGASADASATAAAPTKARPAAAPPAAKAPFVERRGPNRAKNVVRPKFAQPAQDEPTAPSAHEYAAARSGTNDDWTTF